MVLANQGNATDNRDNAAINLATGRAREEVQRNIDGRRNQAVARHRFLCCVRQGYRRRITATTQNALAYRDALVANQAIVVRIIERLTDVNDVIA